jgi:hypothetical protein
MNLARSLAVAGAATAAAIVATAGPASAAASVYKDEGCETFGTFEFCYDVKSVFNVTETPSGNYNAISNGKFSYTYSENGVEYYSTDGKYHNKFSMKDGETQVASYHGKSSDEFGETTCSYTYKFHMANGKVQVDNFDFECTPL